MRNVVEEKHGRKAMVNPDQDLLEFRKTLVESNGGKNRRTQKKKKRKSKKHRKSKRSKK